jgi:hypothetical protein
MNIRRASRKMGKFLWALVGPLLLLLSGCGSANASPTLNVSAIFTSAYQTISAQQVTQLALTPPTNTALPTSLPTLPPPSPLPTIAFASPTLGGVAQACDNSAYVADITIPDGTIMTPGQKFEKKWKIQNTGSCTWNTSYRLAFDSGELMGGAPVAIIVPVPPGNQSDIAVNLTAPTSAGTFTGTWRMQDSNNQPFGSFITVVIKVGSGGDTITPGPSPTPGAGTVKISGNAEKPQVLITYTGSGSGDPSGTTVADDNGKYSFNVPSSWSGSVTPSKGKWIFSPVSRSYTNVTSNQSGQDFNAQ